MKMLTCPINGARPVSEFVCGGDVRPMPNPSTADDATWADYVFNRHSVPGVKQEWWCHTPSNTWFIAERDTRSDQVFRTYLYGDDGAYQDAAQDTDVQNASLEARSHE